MAALQSYTKHKQSHNNRTFHRNVSAISTHTIQLWFLYKRNTGFLGFNTTSAYNPTKLFTSKMFKITVHNYYLSP